MTSYRIECVNVSAQIPKELEGVCCRSMFCIPVFVSPGVENPFRGLGLNHYFDEGDLNNG